MPSTVNFLKIILTNFDTFSQQKLPLVASLFKNRVSFLCFGVGASVLNRGSPQSLALIFSALGSLFFERFSLLWSADLSTMEILSALKSWSSSKEKLTAACKFESPNLRSPRFRRWGSKKQRTSNRKLPTCRENRASSNSVPSSLFGDSCSDLSSVRINTFRSEDYLDPFQGKV